MKPITEVTKSNNLVEVELHYKSKVKPSERRAVATSRDCYNALAEIYNPNKVEHVETFVILLLNRANKILGWSSISTGGVSGVIVDSKVIFQIALNANASNIILSHNHPSGNTKPSVQDIDLTKKVKAAGNVLDIGVFDHVIYTTESYFSFADEGMI